MSLVKATGFVAVDYRQYNRSKLLFMNGEIRKRTNLVVKIYPNESKEKEVHAA
jgi:hypothetical protein